MPELDLGFAGRPEFPHVLSQHEIDPMRQPLPSYERVMRDARRRERIGRAFEFLLRVAGVAAAVFVAVGIGHAALSAAVQASF